MTGVSVETSGILGQLTSLENALKTNDPKMPEHLKNIHKTLIQYEELSHLLSEEQIAVIVEGNQRKLGILLAAETTATKGSKGKSLKGITSDDL